MHGGFRSHPIDTVSDTSFSLSVLFQYRLPVFIALVLSCYHRSMGLLWEAPSFNCSPLPYWCCAQGCIAMTTRCISNLSSWKGSISEGQGWYHWCVTHLPLGKMAAILKTTFSSAFSWMKMWEFRFKFHWNLFLRVQLTLRQHWFR